jgi:inositol phosphorylceramide mannosyltransferase catalytic subunit
MEDLSFEDLDIYLLKQKNKIIHQIWFGVIPNKKEAKKTYKKLKPYRDSWINNNPTWFYMSWNLEKCQNLIKNYYPQHLEMYNNYNYIIQKCDAVRYFILHRYGGLYADMDYFCNTSWDIVLENYPNDLYLVQTPWNSGKEKTQVSNSLMYSVANNQFWSSLFVYLELNKQAPYYYSRHLAIMFTTGPGVINRCYHNYKIKFKLKLYPYQKFHPFGLISDIKTVSTKSDICAFHLNKASWEKIDSKIFVFFYQEYKIILFILLVLLLPYFIRVIYTNILRKK